MEALISGAPVEEVPLGEASLGWYLAGDHLAREELPPLVVLILDFFLHPREAASAPAALAGSAGPLMPPGVDIRSGLEYAFGELVRRGLLARTKV